MKFDRLRIAGFKTFVDPAELVIEPGLTGVVGPNGCGKSNLVEALRWVMGETSHKSMRASGMDDVIFSGSTQRPARNHAEVTIRIDNTAHDAPAAFNEAEQLEISRRIEREAGSTYRINGREVRARDVQLLFADAASGARSPSMVRQGQISEIIAAKPQARRRILEDAAGIAGLHARRHDADLKLKAAEDNLVRVADVLKLIDGQIDGLRRQSRQAERYRQIAADLRKAEAIARQIAWQAAEQAVTAATRQVDLDTRGVASALAQQGESERMRAVAQHAIAPLREKETTASAAVQRLLIAREALEGEERRAEGRIAELDRHLAELARDQERAAQLVADAAAALARLEQEKSELSSETGDVEGERLARQRHDAAEAARTEADAAVEEAQGRLAVATAGRAAAERALADAESRARRIAAERTDAARLSQNAAALLAALPDAAALKRTAEQAGTAVAEADANVQALERATRQAREAEARLRPLAQEAERAAQALDTEARTIRKLVDLGTGGRWPRALDQISVAKGYETALGAAFGDDLDASTSLAAPVHWAGSSPAADDPALPEGVVPLAEVVTAPPALARRLAQIGVVARTDGLRLKPLLRPGQRLVSREGDLWRWDGFIAAAEAPSAAARRLAERNRLGEVERDAEVAARRRAEVRADMEAAQVAVRDAVAAETHGRDALREARRRFDSARDSVLVAERRAAEAQVRASGAAATLARLVQDETESAAAVTAARAALAAAVSLGNLPDEVAALRLRASEARSRAAEARAACQGFVRERELRGRRLAAIADETAAWQGRARTAKAQQTGLTARQDEIRSEHARLDGLPAELMARRRAMTGEIETAEAARKTAADARAEGETALAACERAARDATAAFATAREARARSEAQADAAAARRSDLARAIEDALGLSPAALAEASGIANPGDLPESRVIDDQLVELRRERDRLGAVNLCAADELSAVEQTKTDLTREHDDLNEAIRRLRRGIESLNAEGRNRLMAAFEVVNGHFQKLFTRLFGGGAAELQLVESDDPLEAGLEILANPPGKKPQVLTLLSGGEQALTATALIFAVFLTNPSPVCVLDEVDAPLDDANVERLCDLLADMASETATRFVVITHNPISMARMDRLFGVTMAERGVSQLVSVDLKAAERLVEAAEPAKEAPPRASGLR